jgi:hypothetical protein
MPHGLNVKNSVSPTQQGWQHAVTSCTNTEQRTQQALAFLHSPATHQAHAQLYPEARIFFFQVSLRLSLTPAPDGSCKLDQGSECRPACCSFCLQLPATSLPYSRHYPVTLLNTCRRLPCTMTVHGVQKESNGCWHSSRYTGTQDLALTATCSELPHNMCGGPQEHGPDIQHLSEP